MCHEHCKQHSELDPRRLLGSSKIRSQSDAAGEMFPKAVTAHR